MAATKYTYSISGDFPNQKVDISRLDREIRSSPDIVHALDYIGTTGDACDIWFKTALDSGEQTALDAIVAAHSGDPIPFEPTPKSPLGVPLVENQPREGSSLVIVSHSWTNRCTWYGQSVRVEGETLTDSGDGLTFNSDHTFWINLNHGLLYGEDKIKATYLPVVYIDDVEATEDDPFGGTEHDYSIDYETGDVTFHESQSGNTITADYSYENGSMFLVAPTAGKILRLLRSEVQASTNLAMTDTIRFQPWAYNPADPPNKIPVAAATVYKGWRDFVEEAEGVYPVVPVLPGTNGRGLVNEHVVFPFPYEVVKTLPSALGLEIRIWLENDTPFTGEFGSVTFYCDVIDE